MPSVWENLRGLAGLWGLNLRLGWPERVRGLPALPGGDYLWIGPLGHRYTKSGRPP